MNSNVVTAVIIVTLVTGMCLIVLASWLGTITQC